LEYSIKDLLEVAFKNTALRDKSKENMVFPLWNVVVGQKIALKAHPYRLENGTLKVIVSSSTWTQQLSFMKEQIIKSYLDLTGEEIVKDIKFYTGRRSKNFNPEEPDKTEQLTMNFDKKTCPDEFELSRIKLSEEVSALITEYVSSIGDEKFKKQIGYLIEKDFKVKIWKKNMGWKPCPSCNVLMEPESKVCVICGLKEEKEKKKKKRGRKKDKG